MAPAISVSGNVCVERCDLCNCQAFTLSYENQYIATKILQWQNQKGNTFNNHKTALHLSMYVYHRGLTKNKKK